MDNYHKLYYQKNKTHIKQLVKERYEKKKDDINKKIKCDVCNRVVIARMYKKHCSTNIHNKGPKETTKKIQNEPQNLQKDFVNYNSNICNGWIDFK